jgi:hypothetical protein
MANDAVRLEDHVQMFHAECGGMITGELGRTLTCAECGAVMTAFISDFDQVSFGKPHLGIELVPSRKNTEEDEGGEVA